MQKPERNSRKDGGLNLNTQDIPGAQPRKTLKVAGVKKENFFPELPEIEFLLTKDKKQRGATRINGDAFDIPRSLNNY